MDIHAFAKAYTEPLHQKTQHFHKEASGSIKQQTGAFALGNIAETRAIAYYQITEGDADQVAAFATSGSVTINTVSSDKSSISGIFSFTGSLTSKETYAVTNGTFILDVTSL